jgi:hypothetical protein
VKSVRFGDREIKDGDIDLSNGMDGRLNILLASDGGARFVDPAGQSASSPAE